MHRHSKKRDAVYTAVYNDKTHPTAEQIYAVAKEAEPSLSLGTVYRNLQWFEDQGLVKVVAHTNGQTRYDAGIHTHDHFLCSRCGSVIDTERRDKIDLLIHEFSKSCGVAVDSIVFNGLCSECLKQDSSNRE